MLGVKASDFKVSPFEVESILLTHPAVAEAGADGPDAAADAEAYLSRLAAFATVLDQESDVVRRDVARGISLAERYWPAQQQARPYERGVLATSCACAYLVRGMLPQAAIPGLNAFVLYFALPCMLFRFGASTPLALLLDPVLATVYTVCALVLVGFVVATSLNRRIGWNDAAFGALVAAFPNTGFMGVPLLVALLGPAAAGPVICSVLA